jgi:hypothetical protein
MLVAIAALLVASTGLAAAAIPDADGVIHACFNKRTGAVRIIDTEAPVSATCTSKETALSWNQTGPAGQPGPAGSVSATYVRSSTSTGTAQANCDSGDIVTGGGGSAAFAALEAAYPVVAFSFPNPPSDVPIGYLAESTSSTGQVTAYVVCAEAAP